MLLTGTWTRCLAPTIHFRKPAGSTTKCSAGRRRRHEGRIAVMLAALESDRGRRRALRLSLRNHPHSDEEVGSPGSAALMSPRRRAANARPHLRARALPDGTSWPAPGPGAAISPFVVRGPIRPCRAQSRRRPQRHRRSADLALRLERGKRPPAVDQSRPVDGGGPNNVSPSSR